MHGAVVDGRELLVKPDDVGALYDQTGQDDGYRQSGGGGKWDKKSRWDNKASVAGKGGKGAAAAAPARVWSNRVFFAGAPFATGQQELQAYFEEYGGLRSFTLFRLSDGRSRGMGVCTFVSSEVAAQAVRGGITIDGRPLYLQEDTSQYVEQPGGKAASSWASQALPSYAPVPRSRGGQRAAPYEDENYGGLALDIDPNKAVFFKNVPFETTESHLRQRFEAAGPIRTLRLFMTPDGRSRGMGVVEYQTQAAATRAYNNLHEQNVSGRLMVVDEYRPPA